MDMTTNRFWIAAIMCSILFLSTFAGIAGAQDTDNQTTDNTPVLETDRTTDRFGGAATSP